MASTHVERYETHLHSEQQTMGRVVAGGSVAEALGGAAAVVLAILGLCGVLPRVLASIATITVGAALFFEGSAIASRYSEILAEEHHEPGARWTIGGGMGLEALGGAAGIVLGILALLGMAPLTLMSIAAIVLGATFMLSSGSLLSLNSVAMNMNEQMSDTARTVTRQAMNAAAGIQVLVGAGAVVLGILCLQGIIPLTLVFIAMLSLGGASLLTGSASGSRFAFALRH